MGAHQDSLHQPPQAPISLATAVTAISPDVDTGQNDFLIASRHPCFDFCQNIPLRPATLSSPGYSNDAISTMIVAAVLDLDKGPSTSLGDRELGSRRQDPGTTRTLSLEPPFLFYTLH